MINEERGSYRLMLIGSAALLMSLIIVVLGASIRVLSTPNVLFPILIAMSILILIVLIKMLYPLPSEYSVQPYEEIALMGEGTPNKGYHQSESTQYKAYVDLKQVLKERIMIRLNIGQEELNRMLGDEYSLYQVLGDEDLIRLISLNDRMEVLPRNYRVEGIVLGSGFFKRYDLLLGKVEMWE